MTEVSKSDNEATLQTPTLTDQCRVRFDSSNSKNSYVNACHVASMKEEVVLDVGSINPSGQDRPHIQLTNCIILSLFAAKRLAMFFKQGTLNLSKD